MASPEIPGREAMEDAVIGDGRSLETTPRDNFRNGFGAGYEAALTRAPVDPPYRQLIKGLRTQLAAALAACEEPQTCARSSELASSEGGQQKVEHRRSEAEVGGSIPSGRLQANVVYVQFPDGEIRLLSMEGAPALGETVVYDEPRIYAGRYVVADAEWRFSGGVGEAAFSRRIVILVVASEDTER